MTDKPSPDDLTKDLMKSMLAERRADRRWRNIRTFSWIFLVLIFILLVFMPNTRDLSATEHKPYVALVRLSGPIMPRGPFSATRVIPVLQKAFADKKAKGVVIEINSPGGSPVQAGMIHDKILQLKKKYKKKVVVLGDDALASGAYLVATAADKIYVHKDTLTGSIGVIMSGFGFTGLMEKVGVTRRVFTAGNNKDRLDPFLPLRPADAAKVHKILGIVHQNFIDDVLQGRKGRLHGDKNELFSGDFWTGQQAVSFGLADGIGNLWTILPKEFKVKHYRLYHTRPSIMEVLFKGVESKLNLALGMHHVTLESELPR